VQDIVRRIPTGFRLALSSTSQAVKLGAIWALILAPLYVAFRRRSLVGVRNR
jgi:hypothetical protein